MHFMIRIWVLLSYFVLELRFSKKKVITIATGIIFKFNNNLGE